MTGTIPSEIGQLTGAFRRLQVTNNTMSGTIPEQLYDLKNFERLFINNAGFSGTISQKITTLTKLAFLDLDKNSFTSTLPDISSLTNLELFAIAENNFVGQLPTFVSAFNKLNFADVSRNNFTGTISDGWFTNKPVLQTMYFSNNSFVGSIPANFYEPPMLKDLYFNGNNLVGTIPVVDPSSFSKLEELLFNRNQLTGSVPDSICTKKNNSPLRPNSTQQVFDALWADCSSVNGVVQTACACCTRCFVGGPGS